MKINRQIRYNISTDTSEQVEARHRWTFCVVNAIREIDRVREGIIAVFGAHSPIAEYHKLGEGSIPKSGGLHYEAFSFSHNKGELHSGEKKRIYDSQNFKQDRNLRDTLDDSPNWFETIYIPSISKS